MQQLPLQILWFEIICLVLPIPLFLIGLGLVCIFNKDWAWATVEFSLGALHPQRTARWEERTTVSGAVSIIVGLVMGAIMLAVVLSP